MSLVSPDDQKVTFVELFFDPVFVYCVTQVVTLLHGHIDARSAGSTLLVFWLVWWAWTQFTWALNAANTEHPRIQVITLVATAIAFLLAVGIPDAVAEQPLWFAGPYIGLRILGLVVYDLVASSDQEQRRAVRLFALASTTGLIAVLAGAVVGGQTRYALWALAIVLDLYAAGAAGKSAGWNLHADHFVERYGLVVIIALGETLIVAAAGVVRAPRTAAMVATGALAVAITCGLWWSYFRHVRHRLEHAMASSSGRDQSRLARDAFSVLHFPVLCGVIAVAAATEAALMHPDQPLAIDLRAGLGAGMMLFVCGTAAAVWRATGEILRWRWVVAPIVAIVLIAFTMAPWMAMALVFAGLIVIDTVEHVSRRARHPALEHARTPSTGISTSGTLSRIPSS